MDVLLSLQDYLLTTWGIPTTIEHNNTMLVDRWLKTQENEVHLCVLGDKVHIIYYSEMLSCCIHLTDPDSLTDIGTIIKDCVDNYPEKPNSPKLKGFIDWAVNGA